MSIVPVSDSQRGSNSSLDLWDDPIHRWDLLTQNFPLFLDHHLPFFPSPFGSLETHVDWKETQRGHVFRAVFNGEEDVLVQIDDENMLQISTENGKFTSRFKLSDNAKRDEIKAHMLNGVLTVTVPKEGGGFARSPNIRSIEISGSG